MGFIKASKDELTMLIKKINYWMNEKLQTNVKRI